MKNEIFCISRHAMRSVYRNRLPSMPFASRSISLLDRQRHFCRDRCSYRPPVSPNVTPVKVWWNSALERPGRCRAIRRTGRVLLCARRRRPPGL